jgi:hypothetical protein
MRPVKEKFKTPAQSGQKDFGKFLDGIAAKNVSASGHPAAAGVALAQ